MKARSVFLCALLALTMLTTVALPATEAFARARVSSIRLGNHPDNVTRVVMDLSDNLTVTSFAQASPDRIVLEAGDLDWGDDAAARRSFGAIQGVRYDQGRIVVDLKEPALVKSSFTIPPRDGLGWRLVVDVQKTSRTAFLAAARPAINAPAVNASSPPPRQVTAVPAPEAAADRAIVVYSPQVTPTPVPAPVPRPVLAPQPVFQPPPPPAPAVVVAQPVIETPVQRSHGVTASTAGSPMLSAPVPPPLARPVVEVSAPVEPAPVPALRQPVIEEAATPARAAPEPALQGRSPRSEGKAVVVIDPGHGGVDPGALGVSGIYEKHITLAMARELKAQLEKGGRYKVHLTRDRDVFIRLRERVAIARQYGADLFISLHADSVANPQLAGLSVYTLSQTASDGEAQTLADKENKADLIAGIDLSHESADVANILIDLAQRETMNRSAGFAGGVVTELGRETTLLGNTHRFAGFAVLKAPDVPSILVELGYLSNATEEKLLRQPDYRLKLAKGIARAIDRHFVEGQKAKR
ncbi:N-acetylmuramoyl-L-alanine amidase [Magnetospirillum gryphiswaldense]|uniref:N-acetylmuramoyl-L-alanine amidase n=1 Tax=Magnetospirillum gryphiswaldense TaxID=55518 RepID=UPI000D2079E5|nr:N-acetylmuramoyl-L-alanine amidase [Magnetospirillum gryphiswaldense]AVM73233.1 N-acetylmuramoyl-L-alanine amidase AmiC precursor [Magnetospirillum gryphiswaldense MSR-1]AVM77136.1 N-acetylmuramoyl-L-alanine amidase AmiC precursor [Magnetospirillum gryphiswaldense]